MGNAYNYEIFALRAFYFACALGIDRGGDVNYTFACYLDQSIDNGLSYDFGESSLHCVLNLLSKLIRYNGDLYELSFDLYAHHHQLFDTVGSPFINIMAPKSCLDANCPYLSDLFNKPILDSEEEDEEYFGYEHRERFEEWWKANGSVCSTYLTQILELDHINNFWDFSDQEKQKLSQYYYSNYFLMSCLYRMNAESITATSQVSSDWISSSDWFCRANSYFGNIPINNSCISKTIVEKIENSLFMPIAEIQEDKF